MSRVIAPIRKPHPNELFRINWGDGYTPGRVLVVDPDHVVVEFEAWFEQWPLTGLVWIPRANSWEVAQSGTVVKPPNGISIPDDRNPSRRR